MQNILEYLRQREYENAYIIRGLFYNIKDFKYEVEYSGQNDIVGLIAFWEDDMAVTLRGDKLFCEKWFAKVSRKYNFYDLDENFIDNLSIKSIDKISSNSISYYLIMAYEPETPYYSYEICKNIEYRKIDESAWNSISKVFKENYNKEFTSFNSNNMEWLCVYNQGKAISILCLEKVYSDLLIISNLYVIPSMRRKGIGKRLLNSILRDYAGNRFILFVNSNNTEAISLYKKLGFKVHSKVVNIEIY